MTAQSAGRATEGADANLRGLFDQIVERASGGIWVLDRDGRTRYANAKMAELLLYTRAEMQQLSLADVLDEVGQAQLAVVLERERALEGGVEQVQSMFLRSDGCAIWCLVDRSPLLDDDGRHIGSINLVSDITGRARLDEELRRSKEKLAEAQRAACLGSWDWDLTTQELSLSDEMYHLFGLPTGSEVRYAALMKQIHPADRDLLERAMNGCLVGDPHFDFDCRVILPSGELVWHRGRGDLTRDEFGRPWRLRGTTLDITAFKTAEQELKRTSSRYRLLQATATIANETVSFEQVLELGLAEICQHLGAASGRAYIVAPDPRRLVSVAAYTATPAGDDRIRTVPGPDPVGGVTELAQRVLVAKTQLVTLVEGPEERRAWDVPLDDPGAWSAFAFPVLAKCELVAVLELLLSSAEQVEITLEQTWDQVGAQLARVFARERHSEEVARARDEAMRSSQLKSQFLANMSHEIRTPMNGVLGLTRLLQETDLSDVQRRYADGVHAAGSALLTIINDILDFSKLEAEKLELESAEFDVRTLLDEVATLLGPEARQKELELVTSCLPYVPTTLRGDQGRVRQILLNLAGNALKFTPAGRVAVSVDAQQLPDGRVRLRFEVSDTGIGIDDQSREQLFSSFSQADASTTRRYGGTGLGLAISRRLVEAMQGDIGFDSVLGEGSVFWFELPLAVADSGPLPVPSPTGHLEDNRVGETGPSGRVLIVEDNPVNQMVAEGVMASLNYSADLVSNGVEALEALERGSYVAVLMDCHMPLMDGFEATREIRRREGDGPQIPVIAMTASVMADDRRRCRRVGMDDFVAKPVTPEAIVDALTRVRSGALTAHGQAGAKRESPSATIAEEPAIDPRRLDTLRHLGNLGGSDLLERVVQMYTRDSAASLAAICESVTAHAPADLLPALHQLVGISSNVGANRLVRLCRSLEQDPTPISGAHGQDVLSQLKSEVDAANRSLAEAVLDSP